MAKKIVAHMKSLAKADTAGKACALFSRDFAPLGADAWEAIPLFMETLASLRGRGGENGLACLCYKGFIDIPESLGVEGQTIAAICISRQMIRSLPTLMVPDMQTIVIGIKGSIGRGAEGAEVLPHLKALKQRLAALRPENAGQRSTGLQGAAGSPLVTLLGHVDKAMQAIQDRAGVRKSDAAEAGPSCDDFVRRALENRSSTIIKTDQTCALVDALAKGMHKSVLNCSAEELIAKTTAALRIQCPACGSFTAEAVRHLYRAAKGAFQPGVVGDCVVFSGGGTASVAAGRCPGCQGTTLICTFDPLGIPLRQKSWQRLMSMFLKKGRDHGTDQVRSRG